MSYNVQDEGDHLIDIAAYFSPYDVSLGLHSVVPQADSGFYVQGFYSNISSVTSNVKIKRTDGTWVSIVGEQGIQGIQGEPGIPVVQTITLTGTQHNISLAARCTVLRCNNASLLTITGFEAGYDGQQILIESVGAGQVDFLHQNSGSGAVNRLINFATIGITSLAAGTGRALYTYDIVTDRWKLINHEQGAWITPVYNAGDYTANGAMIWTVDAGDITSCAYILRGKSLLFSFYIVTSSVGGTLNTQLLRIIPGGYVAAKNIRTAINLLDNFIYKVGQMTVVANGTTIIFQIDGTGTLWTACTNSTYVYGTLTIEVQ